MYELLQKKVQNHLGVQSLSFIPISSGVSGLPIFRVDTNDKSFAVRSWPDRPETVEKVRLWKVASQALEKRRDDLQQWFSDCPLPTPMIWESSQGEIVLKCDGLMWTISNWKPGRPISLADLRQPDVWEWSFPVFKLRLAEKLGGLHRIFRDVEPRIAIAPGLNDRQIGLHRLPTEISVPRHSLSRERLQRFQQNLNFHRDNWLGMVDAMGSIPRHLNWAIRDLWRDNVLIDDSGNWVSTVDVGASRIDWPIFDFIRLFGSLRCTKAEWQGAYDTYLRTAAWGREIVLPELSECWRLHLISLAISIHFWLNQLAESNRNKRLYDFGITRVNDLLDEFEMAIAYTSE